MLHLALRALLDPASLFFCVTAFVPFVAGAADPVKGAKIYGGICSSCHGEGGMTEIPGIPSFAKGERLDKPDAKLKESIKIGVSSPDNPSGMAMPPYGVGPALTDKQLDDVIAYMRSLKKWPFFKKPPAALRRSPCLWSNATLRWAVRASPGPPID